MRADANGQLGNRNRSQPELLKKIGMDTSSTYAEKGNGEALRKLCLAYEMVPMNTWRRNPGQTMHDHIEAATWTSPDGKTNRQIDYILVNQKYRNWVRKAHTLHNWRVTWSSRDDMRR